MTSAVIGHMAQSVAALQAMQHFNYHHPKEIAARTLCHSWLDSSQPKRVECEHDLLTAVWRCSSMTSGYELMHQEQFEDTIL